MNSCNYCLYGGAITSKNDALLCQQKNEYTCTIDPSENCMLLSDRTCTINPSLYNNDTNKKVKKQSIKK